MLRLLFLGSHWTYVCRWGIVNEFLYAVIKPSSSWSMGLFTFLLFFTSSHGRGEWVNGQVGVLQLSGIDSLQTPSLDDCYWVGSKGYCRLRMNVRADLFYEVKWCSLLLRGRDLPGEFQDKGCLSILTGFGVAGEDACDRNQYGWSLVLCSPALVLTRLVVLKVRLLSLSFL